MPAEHVKFTLPEERIPTHWVNLLPDLPGDPLPPLNPRTMQPAGPDDLTRARRLERELDTPARIYSGGLRSPTAG